MIAPDIPNFEDPLESYVVFAITAYVQRIVVFFGFMLPTLKHMYLKNKQDQEAQLE